MVAWYKHDIPAWMDGTASLSDGAYRAYHVICQQIYVNEGPIALNERYLAGSCNQSVKAFRGNLKELTDAGKLVEIEGRLSNSRAVLELENVSENRKNAAKGGKNSGKARKNSAEHSSSENSSNENNDDSEATLQQNRTEKTRLEKTRQEESREDKTHSSSDDAGQVERAAPLSATQPSPPAETPLFGDLGKDQPALPRARGTALVPADDTRHRAIDAATPGFEAWWSAYPLKKAKGGAKKRYAAIVQAGQATEAQLLDGALRYAAEKAGTDPKYTKYPTTWLNNSCWLDEPDKPPDANGFGMLSSTSQRFLQNSAYLKDQQ